VGGFVTILVGTVVLARFGGEQIAEELEAAQRPAAESRP
jgi:hypothetical protein